MTNNNTHGSDRAPDERESPVTLSLIQELIDEHPDYRVTKHMTQGGHKFTLIEYPDHNNGFLEGAPGEFVSWVSELECSLHTESEQ